MVSAFLELGCMTGWPSIEPTWTNSGSAIDFINGPQAVTLNWLIKAHCPAVFSAPLQNGLPDWLEMEWSHGFRGSVIGMTPLGPTCWVRNGQRWPRTRFKRFLKEGGFTPSIRGFAVDHAISGHAHRLRFVVPQADDLHLLLLANASTNSAWGAWEKRHSRRTDMLDFWVIAKSLGLKPPYARAGRKAWEAYAATHGPTIAGTVKLSSSGTPMPTGLLSGPDDDARKMLRLPLGTLVAVSDFVTWRLLADTIATWEAP